MKRIVSIILILCVTMLFFGCGDDTAIQEPVNFYYQTADVIYNNKNGVIAFEVRESEPYRDDLVSLLNHYLQGPVSDNLRNPFLQDAQIESVLSEDNLLKIYVNEAYAQLSGLELTLANSCLCKTALEVTQNEAVQITCENALLDGYQSVTVSDSDLLLIDAADETAP